jgi:hypothetical protein
MTEANDVVQLPLADAEKCNGITHRVSGEAFGAQARIVERHGQQRIIGTQRSPFGGRSILDLKQCLEMPSALMLQGISPALEPLGLR